MKRLCAWCRAPFDAVREDERFHGRKCRQAAWRLRRRMGVADAGADDATKPGRFAYADPPYPGLSRRYYGDQPTYAGEVDHEKLIASLGAGGFVGWALSTSARALRQVLPLCPEDHRVCAWVKPIGVSSRTFGPHNAWEPLIVVGGRKLRPGKRDWVAAQPARFEGSLMGRKPTAFCAFLFQMLGMLPGDELVDLFPGTGIVSRAWAEISGRPGASDASPGAATTLASVAEASRPGRLVVVAGDPDDAFPLFRKMGGSAC